MFITKDDLSTHLRGEITDILTRADDAIVEAAIDGAIAEARGYLGRYDVAEIFARQGSDRNALLLIFCKDIAVWHLINLSAAGINYDKREKRYNRAVEWLKGVRKGDVSPDLPMASGLDASSNPSLIIINSNPKRVEHF